MLTLPNLPHHPLAIYLCFVITFTFFLLWGKNSGDSYYSIKSIQDLLTNPEFPNQVYPTQATPSP